MSRLTIVVPAWNLGAPLVECLESLRQADESAKVILVNNASDTPLPGTDRVTELTLPRRVSVGAARNAGLAKVTTPYVMFMDGDDILLPGALRYLVETLERRTDAVAVSGRAVAWDPHFGVEEPKDWPFDWTYRLAERPRAFAWVNCVRNVFPTVGAVVIRTSIVRTLGGFCDANWAEDWCLGEALCFQGPVIMGRRTCVRYRIDTARTTLSDVKERRLRPSWEGRRAVRLRLRNGPGIPTVARIVSWLLIPVHAGYVVQDLLAPRQRVSLDAARGATRTEQR